jgi:hypothetical protein
MNINPTEAQKNVLRKIHICPDKIKAIVYGGNISGGTDPIIRFGSDMHYGLYWALQSVKSYEGDGFYAPGTAQKAMAAALTIPKVAKAKGTVADSFTK